MTQVIKQDTPPTAQKEKPLSELSKEEIVDKLANFQEALKSEKFKGLDVYDILKLEKPSKNIGPDEKVVTELTSKYESVVSEMKEAGVPIPSSTKMSEAEKKINERLEKQSQAKFAEQKNEILKLDKDAPIDVVEKLPISTDDKVTVATHLKEVFSRNAEAVKKVKDELDTITSELNEVKMRAPAAPAKDQSGGDKVSAKMKEWNYEDPSAKNKE